MVGNKQSITSPHSHQFVVRKQRRFLNKQIKVHRGLYTTHLSSCVVICKFLIRDLFFGVWSKKDRFVVVVVVVG